MFLSFFHAKTTTQFWINKSTNKKSIVVYPNESKTITGMVRRTSHYENAVTENIDESNDLNVCPCVVAVKANSKTARIPVRVCNISAQPITIKPRSQMCSLQEVNVIITMDPSCDSVSVGSSSKSFEDLGINLHKKNLSQSELHKAKDLLGSWKHIFSTGPTDLGFTNLIVYEIKLVDETPFKESKVAKIRNRYNQVPHLTQDTNGKVTNSQKTPQTRAKRSALSQQVTTKHI